jgi:hypothetical protein
LDWCAQGIPLALFGTVLAGVFSFSLSRSVGPQLITGVSGALAKIGLKVEGAEEDHAKGKSEGGMAKVLFLKIE